MVRTAMSEREMALGEGWGRSGTGEGGSESGVVVSESLFVFLAQGKELLLYDKG